MHKPEHEAAHLENRSELKASSVIVAQHFLADDATKKDGKKILDCAHHLRSRSNNGYDAQIDTWYCKHPQCPTCQSRRALRCCSKMHQLCDQNPTLTTGKWIFLTLTVRNCFVEELRTTIAAMNRAFGRLKQRAFWKQHVYGGIKFMEVTPGRSDVDMAHPHFHCLLRITPSMYEGNNYISMKRWAREWQQALQVSYTPVVDCKRLSGVGDDLRRQIVSYTRYSMKPHKPTRNRFWFMRVAFETKDLHRFQPFGQIKVLLAQCKKERSLTSPDEAKDTAIRATESIWTWDAWSGKYRLRGE
ncbi:protein rep [Marinobacter subterrani]|uniref:Replication protein n=1 Tax=Marinobacter subterrani TaxID=1658765 RepID=A0A0J7M604_9GAMM|nr:protein rep [Marinobacter subterrani]KMQ76385.1 Replication protein [Marinobacter subterrani]